ncbi:voltage-dependent calcium channel subunit alpha-2/delta-3-like protein 2 [Leptotrombidium deliense]|uniref:Voltage-dependent calcium channel subunit alpha-2/delta-3-like protein 2 n=1 Tax=Leptotrombidium deliense TaxID=299467 RepID=A0A443SAD1_9ACAR|nr:voltage-dependent calcium channel subunit alpha-2/delta-3-like protein 2 [Leptotrombidium deliense]
MGVKVDSVHPPQLLDYFITDVQNMFKWKREHVERIAVKAEAEAANYTYEPHLLFFDYDAKRLYDGRFEEKYTAAQKATANFRDMKDADRKKELEKWHDLLLTPNIGYNNAPVNMEKSVIHLPVNVYGESVSISNSIKWSSALTQIFRNNKNHDYDLSWQYFCSIDGYLRLFPATKWRLPDHSNANSDLYDCRLQPSFIKAAASPKDVVILLDRSQFTKG